MAEVVYSLCALTSLTCAAMLFRSYFRTHVRLLFWCGLCFVGLAGNNIVLFVDLILLPKTIDLSSWRQVASLTGCAFMLCALIWNTV